MKKTVNLTEENIEKIKAYQKEKKLKKFEDALNQILNDNEISFGDGNFILLADAMIKMNDKLDSIAEHLAPKSAGSVKRDK